MPELPEVEIMARNMARWATGRTIREVAVLDPKVVVGGSGAQDLQDALEGATVHGAHRRAKYAVLLAGQHAVLWHFRMTGKVVRERGTRPARLGLRMDGERWLWLVDPRRLAHVERVDAAQWRAVLAARGLGDEPWPERRDGPWWSERLASASGPLKAALMDQRRVAGLGNIAASEICWEAALHPASSPRALCAEDWGRVADAAHRFIARVLREEDGDEITFVSQGGRDSRNPFRVYRKAESPCPRCGGTIGRQVDAGRATFCCEGCQTRRTG